MICGKCKTEQKLERRDIAVGTCKETFTYYCPNCKDQVSPGACYHGKVKA